MTVRWIKTGFLQYTTGQFTSEFAVFLNSGKMAAAQIEFDWNTIPWYLNVNYMRWKLSAQKFKLYLANRADMLNKDNNVQPLNFPEAVPIDQQDLKGQGDKWSERARYS